MDCSQPAALGPPVERHSKGRPSGNNWPPSVSAPISLRGAVVICRSSIPPCYDAVSPSDGFGWSDSVWAPTVGLMGQLGVVRLILTDCCRCAGAGAADLVEPVEHDVQFLATSAG